MLQEPQSYKLQLELEFDSSYRLAKGRVLITERGSDRQPAVFTLPNDALYSRLQELTNNWLRVVCNSIQNQTKLHKLRRQDDNT